MTIFYLLFNLGSQALPFFAPQVVGLIVSGPLPPAVVLACMLLFNLREP